MVNYTSLNTRPTIKVHDKTRVLNLQGSGGEVVCFIGDTNNTVDTVTISSYTGYENAATARATGGVEEEKTDNSSTLLPTLKEFFQEAQPENTGDYGINKIYAIDLGVASAITSEKINKALELTNDYHDITMIVFTYPVECTAKTTSDSTTYTINKDIVTIIQENITKLRNKGQPRIVYLPAPQGVTDEQMIAFTDKDTGIQSDDICIIENIVYGKVVAKIAVTPYYVEVGRDGFRTVEDGTFTKRSDDRASALEVAGIITCEADPYRVDPDDETIPLQCIVVGVSTGRAAVTPSTGCILHARRNNNHQIREVMKIIGTQLKENETVDSITRLRLSLSNYFESELSNNYIDSYDFRIYEKDTDPYNVVVDLTIAGVNATYLIDYNNEISNPVVTVSGYVEESGGV